MRGSNRGLQGVTGCYKGSQGVKGEIQVVTEGYTWLQGVIMVYTRLQRVKRG